MAGHFDKNAQVGDYHVKSERLCVPLSIVFNATPASKTNSNDLPNAMALDLEGQLAASAIDAACNFTTPSDATGIFGILLYNLGKVEKLLTLAVLEPTTGTVAITRVGASSTGVTASGNIAISVDWSGNLATTSLSAVCVVDYRISKA